LAFTHIRLIIIGINYKSHWLYIRVNADNFILLQLIQNMTNPIKKRVGIIGGGQLGRMMIEESLRLNVHFNVLDADKNCSCAPIANRFFEGKLTDADKINELAQHSDVLTYEIEHVNTAALIELENAGKTIIPSPRILQIIQDKGLQKKFYTENKIPTLPYVLVNKPTEWADAIKKLGTEKIVAKTRTGGYDGKGVAILSAQEIIGNPATIPFSGPCVLEAFLPCEKELAVIVASDVFGNILSYPSIEMEFDSNANLVKLLVSPANVGSNIEQMAEQVAINVIKAFNGAGLFAVEMFLSSDGNIYVNETAPRPHNSGHHTIEGCYTSQFEQLVRIITGLPLGSTNLIKPYAAMVNLLGSNDFTGSYKLQGLEDVMKIQGVYVHLYNKKESRPMRKMGHVTIIADSYHEIKKLANYITNHLIFLKD
jgi:5-(carboxyamino)imidazole ribonucleotide synthase